MCVIVLLSCLGGALGHTDITSTHSKVQGHGTFYELSENREHAGFLQVGMIGGFTVEHLWP